MHYIDGKYIRRMLNIWKAFKTLKGENGWIKSEVRNLLSETRVLKLKRNLKDHGLCFCSSFLHFLIKCLLSWEPTGLSQAQSSASPQWQCLSLPISEAVGLLLPSLCHPAPSSASPVSVICMFCWHNYTVL